MGVSNVRCNVEDHRLLDNGVRCEDVTSFTLPDIKHPTTDVKASGLIMDLSVPNKYHFESMEFKVSHNNGNNCAMLSAPGKHSLEGRIARQNYGVAQGEMDLELVKVRAVGLHVSTEKGDIETGNPYGSTETFSVLRYEEEIDGEVTTLIDSTTGQIRINGIDYSGDLSAILD